MRGPDHVDSNFSMGTRNSSRLESLLQRRDGWDGWVRRVDDGLWADRLRTGALVALLA